jgi:hypothetical protein
VPDLCALLRMSVENCDYSEKIWTAEKILILVSIFETVAHSHPKPEKKSCI